MGTTVVVDKSDIVVHEGQPLISDMNRVGGSNRTLDTTSGAFGAVGSLFSSVK
jgi:hypothetical protein